MQLWGPCLRDPAPMEGFSDLEKQVPNQVLPVDQPLGDYQKLMYDAFKLLHQKWGRRDLIYF